MDTNGGLEFCFSVFCDKVKILQYLIDFQNELKSDVIEIEKLKLFQKNIHFFSNCNLLDCKLRSPDCTTSTSDIDDALLEILDVIVQKDLKITLKLRNNDYYLHVFEIVYDIIKRYILQIKDKDYVSNLIKNICSFFTVSVSEVETYSSLNESEASPMFYSALKFISRVLKCIPNKASNSYLSETDIFSLIETLSLTDSPTVSIFVGHILPAITQFSNKTFTSKILEHLYSVICVQFEKVEENDSVEIHNALHPLFCSVAEYIYSSNPSDVLFKIHNEKTFWKIIFSGLASSSVFTRKKTLNVFKIFLFWVESGGLAGTEERNNSFMSSEDIKVWYDIILLFESLEEKQIHVIKPVLPKFERILSLTIVKDTIDESARFSSEWVMIILHRMLKHETRFVVKWALSSVLSMDFKTYCFHQQNPEDLIKLLIEAVNDQSLFSRNNEQDNFTLFISSEKITEFLKNYLYSLHSESSKANLMRCIIGIIANQSWCAVALLHFVHALSELNSILSWNKTDLAHIRTIILDSRRSQEAVFRGALEYFMLNCCTLFLDWNVLLLEDLAELLTLIKSTTVLRHSGPWNKFSSKLGTIIRNGSSITLSYESTEQFLSQFVERFEDVNPKKISGLEIGNTCVIKTTRMLLMLADAGIVKPDLKTWTYLLGPILATLRSASNRPYLNDEKFFHGLKLITHFIKESCAFDLSNKDIHTTIIITCLNDCSDLIEFLCKRLLNCSDKESYSYILQGNLFFETLDNMSIHSEFESSLCLGLKNVSDKIKYFLKNKLDTGRTLSVLLPLWKIFISIDNCNHQALSYELLSTVLSENLLHECLSKPTNLNALEREEWISFSLKVMSSFWEIATRIVQVINPSDLETILQPLSEEIKLTLCSGPKLAVPLAIDCMKYLIPSLGYDDTSDLLESAWISCLELRGNEAFRPSFIALIGTIFQQGMLNKMFFDILYKYFERFIDLSESTIGLFYCVMKQICSEFTLKSFRELNFDCATFFLKGLTFGPIHQKAQKIMEETIVYLIEHDAEFANALVVYESNKPSCYVRIATINFLLNNISEGIETNQEFSYLLISELLKVDINDDGKQTSHFNNSFSHRVRTRAWQAILLLKEYVCDSNLNLQFLYKTLDTLGAENQQPSMRYLQEWVIFNILHAHPDILDKFISIFEHSLNKRPSYIISIISVTNILILHGIIREENKAKKCFKLLIILCMAQNFTVRLYAQMTLMNLYEMCQKNNLSSVLLQHEFVSQLQEMQSSLSGQGNFFKNVQKLSNDFYFTVFRPLEHFTLETIFYELPRLANLSPDEWIKPLLFKGMSSNYFPIFNKNNQLKSSQPTSWSIKPLNDTYIPKDSLDYNFQKKIIPSKDTALCLGMDENGTQKENGLIVVASLIDRIPNLGGLCRTCEVFGVSEFILGSMKYIEDKQFQNLAVSADKWVKIKEVKPYQLKEYLSSMKNQGYVLIGAEQTEDSNKLDKFNFPKKTVLLLGHEKEGLPVDLIKLLDVCVEIPQQGVVRSLNVHVSGAILIWEYARQHIKS